MQNRPTNIFWNISGGRGKLGGAKFEVLVIVARERAGWYAGGMTLTVATTSCPVVKMVTYVPGEDAIEKMMVQMVVQDKTDNSELAAQALSLVIAHAAKKRMDPLVVFGPVELAYLAATSRRMRQGNLQAPTTLCRTRARSLASGKKRAFIRRPENPQTHSPLPAVMFYSLSQEACFPLAFEDRRRQILPRDDPKVRRSKREGSNWRRLTQGVNPES